MKTNTSIYEEGTCQRTQNGECVFKDDVCNEMIQKLRQADGLVVGAPVYYGVPAGQVLSLVQRMFFAAGEAAHDTEGMQTMRTLGKNMAWMIKSLKREEMPEREVTQFTNFIR